MYQTLDGPGINDQINVTTTPSEARVGVARYAGRQVVSIQPLDGKIWYGYSSAVSSTNGTLLLKKEKLYHEATDQSEIWLVADSGTVRVAIGELS